MEQNLSIEDQARLVISQYKDRRILMLGLPMDAKQLPDDPTFINSICRACKTPVQSTEVKELIVELTKNDIAPAYVLCLECTKAIMQKSIANGKEIEVRKVAEIHKN